jgi:hypothetical protein
MSWFTLPEKIVTFTNDQFKTEAIGGEEDYNGVQPGVLYKENYANVRGQVSLGFNFRIYDSGRESVFLIAGQIPSRDGTHFADVFMAYHYWQTLLYPPAVNSPYVKGSGSEIPITLAPNPDDSTEVDHHVTMRCRRTGQSTYVQEVILDGQLILSEPAKTAEEMSAEGKTALLSFQVGGRSNYYGIYDGPKSLPGGCRGTCSGVTTISSATEDHITCYDPTYAKTFYGDYSAYNTLTRTPTYGDLLVPEFTEYVDDGTGGGGGTPAEEYYPRIPQRPFPF